MAFNCHVLLGSFNKKQVLNLVFHDTDIFLKSTSPLFRSIFLHLGLSSASP